jgi:hypothetical protein
MEQTYLTTSVSASSKAIAYTSWKNEPSVSDSKKSEGTIAPRTNLIIEGLLFLKKKASYENWDGRAGLPVSTKALGVALNLLNEMPNRIPLPEYGSDPDGAVVLDWTGKNRQDLSISINELGRCIFTGWINDQEVGGIFEFDGHFPNSISTLLTKIIQVPSIRL